MNRCWIRIEVQVFTSDRKSSSRNRNDRCHMRNIHRTVVWKHRSKNERKEKQMKLKKNRGELQQSMKRNESKYGPTTEHKEIATKINVIYFTICTIWKMNKTFIQFVPFFFSLNLSWNCISLTRARVRLTLVFRFMHFTSYVLSSARFVSKNFISFLFWFFFFLFAFFGSLFLFDVYMSTWVGKWAYVWIYECCWLSFSVDLSFPSNIDSDFYLSRQSCCMFNTII